MDEILTEDMGGMYKLFHTKSALKETLVRNAPNLTACYKWRP